MESTLPQKIEFNYNSSIPYQSKDKIAEELRFWYVEEIERKDYIHQKYVFNYIGLYSFLQFHQIGRLKKTEDQTVYVHAHDNIVKEVPSEDIKDFVINAAEKEENDLLLQMLYRGSSNYLSEVRLSNLKFINLRFLKSAQKIQYLHFNNLSLEITPTGISQVDRTKLNGFIWNTEIIDYKLAIYDKPLIHVTKDEQGRYIADDIYEQLEDCDFYKYLRLTSFYNHREAEEAKEKNLQQEYSAEYLNQLGFISKMSAIGYLLHSYKDSACTKAIICMDAKMSEVGSSFGRTGKSIFGKAISKFLKYYYINGRDPRFEQENHKYDGLDESYKLLFVDDADQNLSFSMFYTLITGEFTVNSKNEKKLIISFEKSPKLLITTNHAVKGDDPSDVARQFLIGFSDYFSEERTPTDVLGRRLFDDWDYKQWNLFYNLCLSAIQIYLEHGLVEAKIESLTRRRLRQSIGENFITWAENYFDAINVGIEIEKQKAYEDFEKMFSQYVKKYCSIRQFKKKLRDYAGFAEYVYNKGVKDKDGNPHGGDIKTNGKEYFTYHTSVLNITEQ